MAKETKETEIKILLTTDGKQTQATLKLTDDQVVKLRNSMKSLGSVDSQMKGFVTTLRSVAGAMGLAFGANEIFNFMKSSVAEIQKQDKVARELKATLDSTGYAAGLTSQEILDLAENLEVLNRFAIGKEEIVDASGLLLTFTKINKEIFPETIQLALDLSTRFKQDLKSSIVQIGKALNDPIAGVTALSRVGVQFTDEQKALIKSLVEENDLLSAQKVIMQELSIQVSGSTAASITDFDFKVRQLNEALDQLRELTGEGLVESFTILPVFIKDVELGLGGVLQIAQNLNEMLMNSRLRGIMNALIDPNDYIRTARNKATTEVQGKSEAEVRGMVKGTQAMIAAMGKLDNLSADDKNTIDQLKAKLGVYQNTLSAMIAIRKEKDKDKKKKPEHPEIINPLTGETEDWLLKDALIWGSGNQQGPARKKIDAGFGAPAWQTMFAEGGANSITAGVNAFWDNFINKQREAKNGWDAIWLAMKDSALRQLRDILVSEVWKTLLSLFTSFVPGLGSLVNAGGSAASMIAGPASGPLSKIAEGNGMHNLSAMMDSKLDRFASILEAKQFRVRGEDIETTQTVLKQNKKTYGS